MELATTTMLLVFMFVWVCGCEQMLRRAVAEAMAHKESKTESLLRAQMDLENAQTQLSSYLVYAEETITMITTLTIAFIVMMRMTAMITSSVKPISATMSWHLTLPAHSHHVGRNLST